MMNTNTCCAICFTSIVVVIGASCQGIRQQEYNMAELGFCQVNDTTNFGKEWILCDWRDHE